MIGEKASGMIKEDWLARKSDTVSDMLIVPTTVIFTWNKPVQFWKRGPSSDQNDCISHYWTRLWHIR